MWTSHTRSFGIYANSIFWQSQKYAWWSQIFHAALCTQYSLLSEHGAWNLLQKTFFPIEGVELLWFSVMHRTESHWFWVVWESWKMLQLWSEGRVWSTVYTILGTDLIGSEFAYCSSSQSFGYRINWNHHVLKLGEDKFPGTTLTKNWSQMSNSSMWLHRL